MADTCATTDPLNSSSGSGRGRRRHTPYFFCPEDLSSNSFLAEDTLLCTLSYPPLQSSTPAAPGLFILPSVPPCIRPTIITLHLACLPLLLLQQFFFFVTFLCCRQLLLSTAPKFSLRSQPNVPVRGGGKVFSPTCTSLHLHFLLFSPPPRHLFFRPRRSTQSPACLDRRLTFTVFIFFLGLSPSSFLSFLSLSLSLSLA